MLFKALLEYSPQVDLGKVVTVCSILKFRRSTGSSHYWLFQ